MLKNSCSNANVFCHTLVKSGMKSHCVCFNKRMYACRGGGGKGGYSHIWAIMVCAAPNLGYGSSMVFSRFRNRASILTILGSDRVS